MDALLQAVVLPAATRSLLVRFKVTLWTATARDQAATKQAGLDGSGSYVMKQLVDKALINDIVAEARSIRREIERATLPWSDEGERLLPASMIESFRMLCVDLRIKYDGVVDRFVADYERARRAQKKKKLGSLYSDDDYPSADDVRAKFVLDVQYYPLPTGREFDALTIPRKQRDELRRGTAQATDDAIRRAERYFIDRLRDVADKIYDQIAHQKTKLRSGSYDLLRQLLEVAEPMNILQNKRLVAAAELLREGVADVDAFALRNDVRTQEDALRALEQAIDLLKE